MAALDLNPKRGPGQAMQVAQKTLVPSQPDARFRFLPLLLVVESQERQTGGKQRSEDLGRAHRFGVLLRWESGVRLQAIVQQAPRCVGHLVDGRRLRCNAGRLLIEPNLLQRSHFLLQPLGAASQGLCIFGR